MASGTSKRPVFHYFDIGRLGRGEVVRLLLRDLGIDFEDRLYKSGDTWPPLSKSLEEQGLTVTGKLPILEIDGHNLSQHIPILRYLARSVGGYDGTSNYDKFLVDAVSDLYIDWRSAWGVGRSMKSADYKTITVPRFYSAFADYYARSGGPYLLGDVITYADFAVFQALDNDAAVGAAPAVLPEPLQKLQDAIYNRPNIKDYLAARNAR